MHGGLSSGSNDQDEFVGQGCSTLDSVSFGPDTGLNANYGLYSPRLSGLIALFVLFWLESPWTPGPFWPYGGSLRPTVTPTQSTPDSCIFLGFTPHDSRSWLVTSSVFSLPVST